MPDLLGIARAAAEAGAEVLRERAGDPRLPADEKSPNDFVTAADRASEEAICGVLERRVPAHRILAEEGGARGSAESPYEWIVDPLDGTSNFMAGLPIWGVSVCCLRDRAPVVAVTLEPLADRVWEAELGAGARQDGESMRVTDRTGLEGSFVATGFPFKAKGAVDVYLDLFRDVFASARSIRRCGAAVLDLARTGAGVYDGFFEFRLAPWDLAAGALMIREAGGQITDLDGGDRFLETGNVVGGGSETHAALLEVVQRHASEALLDRLAPPAR